MSWALGQSVLTSAGGWEEPGKGVHAGVRMSVYVTMVPLARVVIFKERDQNTLGPGQVAQLVRASS